MQYYADPTITRSSERWYDEEHLACIALVFKTMEDVKASGMPCIVLQPDPTNEHSKTAVSVHYLGKLIGYVRNEQTVPVLEMIAKNGGNPLLCRVVEVSANDKLMFVQYGEDGEMEMPDSPTTVQTDSAWVDVKVEGIDGTPLFKDVHQCTNALSSMIMQWIIPQIETIGKEVVSSYVAQWKNSMFLDLSLNVSSVTKAMIAAFEASQRTDLEEEIRVLNKALVSRGGWKSYTFRREEMLNSILKGKEIATLYDRKLREMGTKEQLVRTIEEQLASLPDNLIDAVGNWEQFVSKISYLNLPEQLLDNVFALALLYHYSKSEHAKETNAADPADFMKALRAAIRKASRNALKNTRSKATIAPYAAAYLMAFRDGKKLPIKKLTAKEFNNMLDAGDEIHKTKYSTYTSAMHHGEWDKIQYTQFELEKYMKEFGKFVKN